MLPDRVSNPGPLAYESGALPIALRGPAKKGGKGNMKVAYNINAFPRPKTSNLRRRTFYLLT